MKTVYNYSTEISIITIVVVMLFVSGFDRENKIKSKNLEKNISKENFISKKEKNFSAKSLVGRDYVESFSSDSMLIDSVLTTVRNYYVDESRVDCASLMKSALRGLARYDFLQVSFENKNHAYLRSKKHEIQLNLKDSYSFTSLVSDSLRVSKFLDSNEDLIRDGKLRSGAHIFLESLLGSLDPHSNLLSIDEYRDLRQGTNGSFGGLGIVVGLKDDVLTVIKPISRSPAARAGVLKADKILKIDGKSTFGMTLDGLVQYMRGDPGTTAELLILREGNSYPQKISLVREVVQVDSVEAKVLSTTKGPICYVLIDNFSAHTASELRDALMRCTVGKSELIGVILDLRSNPGGLLDQAVKVADLFLEEGRIVSTIGRTKDVELARKNLVKFDYPLIVITDSDTASASEIVAGALRDHDRALIIGEPSFGKGSVQTVFEMSDDFSLKLTIARYFTPRGISIQNRGIIPDIWIQPIHENWMGGNKNLLGPFRYKSERFLEHTLDGNLDQNSVNNGLHGLSRFYLKKGSEDNLNEDFPIELAKNVFSGLVSMAGFSIVKNKISLSYWRNKARELTEKKLDTADIGSQLYLKDKLGIDWSRTREFGFFDPSKNHGIKLEFPDHLTVNEGEALEIPWQIKYSGNNPIHRLSIFISSSKSSVPSNEILIGKIVKGQFYRGKLPVDLSSYSAGSPLILKISLAESGWPLEVSTRDIIVDYRKINHPEISMSMVLKEDVGGSESGVLEAGEKAILEFILVNNSSHSIEKVDISLINLSGSQFVLGATHLRLNQWEAGQVRKVRLPVGALNDLVSTQFELGAVLTDGNNLFRKKSRFLIPSKPALKVSKIIEADGSEKWKEN